MSKAFSIMAITALVLAVALTTLSAYIRLSKAGLDCPDWPECYGRIGVKAEQVGAKGVDPYQRLLEEAQQPLSLASRAHRTIAAATSLLVVLMAGISLLRRRASGPSALIPLALVGLTAFLAWLGIWSKGLHSPAVVMGNLIGGVTMAVLLWWLILSMGRSSRPGPSDHGGWIIRGAVLLGFLLVVLQIVLGGLTSAEYAALSCPTLLDCGGQWWPAWKALAQLDIFRELLVDAGGKAAQSELGPSLLLAHRLAAALLLFYLGALGLSLFSAGGRYRAPAAAMLFLLVAEIALASLRVFFRIPAAATAHHLLALLLLFSLLFLYRWTEHLSVAR